MFFMKIFAFSKVCNFPYSSLKWTKVVIDEINFESANFRKLRALTVESINTS
jgi:hypothetical protein